MPFTLTELAEEFYKFNVVGLFIGMCIIPVVILEPEDTPVFQKSKDKKSMAEALEELKKTALEQLDSNPLLEPRFLSLFNEMIDNGVISPRK